MAESIKDRCGKLIQTLQAVKAKRDSKRAELQQKAKAIKAKYAKDIAPLKTQIAAMHDEIRPIDELLSTVNSAKTMKGQDGERIVQSLEKKAEALK